MENHNEVKDRLLCLQSKMKENQIDWYLILTSDPHSSEYIPDHYKLREYYSGFTGSAGTLLVGLEEVCLWTDGRYFLQAREELEGSGIALMKSGMPGVPNLTDFIKSNITTDQCLATDGFTMSAKLGKELSKICKKKNAIFLTGEDLAGSLMEERSRLVMHPIRKVPLEICGMSTSDKLKGLRKCLKESGANSGFFSALDEVMWLFNIRGEDIEYNPVAYSYAYVDKKSAVLFIGREAISDDLIHYGQQEGFAVVAYGGLLAYLSRELSDKKKILLDLSSLNYEIYREIEKKAGKVICEMSPLRKMKAIKNEAEIRSLKNYFLQDSVAVTKFLYWIDRELENGSMVTETVAAGKLKNLRENIEGYLCDSFSTISAYGKNAAVIHYEPSDEHHVIIQNKGFLLVDSGGQYPGATTDVTRTIVCGELTKEETENFTRVAMGFLDLMNVRWPEGISGRNLDILARRALWNNGLDYRHGTGHGVGCCLCVHEGPHSIVFRKGEASDHPLTAGMLVTDEPGYYEPDAYGIRTENTLLVIKDRETDYGQFYRFEPLTFVPLDKRAMDIHMMNSEQIREYNAYQSMVYDRISPFLTEDESRWLLSMTSDLT